MASIYLPYVVTLRAPLLISTSDGDPNSVRAAHYVPGSTLRGAIAATLDADREPRFFEDLVLSGRVRYLNAYPAADGDVARRSLPVPLSWRVHKGDAGDHGHQDLYDLAALSSYDELPEKVDPVDAGYPFFVPGADLRAVCPRLRAHFHHQRDRIAGRATEAIGAIFTYEALEPGTQLVGRIAVDGVEEDGGKDPRVERLKAALTSDLRLGRSRRTQYGGWPRIEVGKPKTCEIDSGWSQLLRGDGELSAGSRFRLLLTADAVVRDPDTGQVDPAALDAEVRAAFAGRVTVERRFSAARLIAGFNAHWRLAVPQVPAVAAGSVLELRATAPIDGPMIRELEDGGLGERRVDGFGRCLVLRAAQSPVTWMLPGDVQSEPERPPEGTGGKLFSSVQQRLFEAALERAVESCAASLMPAAESGQLPLAIRRSLIGRLRTPLRRGAAGLEVLASWLPVDEERSALRPAAREQLAAVRLAGSRRPRLDDWLRDLLVEDPQMLEDLDRQLFESRSLQSFSLSGEVSDETRRKLVLEARAPLIDAVLALLARRVAEENVR